MKNKESVRPPRNSRQIKAGRLIRSTAPKLLSPTNCVIFGSLLRDGRPILGAISHPLNGHVLMGQGGGPTLLGDRPVRVRPAPKFEEATVLSTGHWEIVKRPDGVAFEAISRRALLYRTWGDCHGYFQVATGGADAMFDPALKPRDICALVPVIEGAGGRATSIDGGDPVLGTDMLASSGALHEELLWLMAAG